MSARAGAALVVRVPGTPSPALSPNARVHWGRRAMAASLARGAAHYATREAVGVGGLDPDQPFPGDGPIRVGIAIGLGYRRRATDVDNALASCKALLDGVAAAMGVDDKRFRPVFLGFVRAAPGDRAGWVELTVTAEQGAGDAEAPPR